MTKSDNSLIGLYYTGKHVIVEKNNEILIINPNTWKEISINNEHKIQKLIPILHYQVINPSCLLSDILEKEIDSFLKE